MIDFKREQKLNALLGIIVTLSGIVIDSKLLHPEKAAPLIVVTLEGRIIDFRFLHDSNEPAPNGSRVNMGAYGNTVEASKTDDGTFIPTECEHKNTTIINKKDATEQEEGYTGDTYCNDCDKIIAIGKTLPRIIASTSETTKEADYTQTTKKADVTNKVKDSKEPVQFIYPKHI